MKAIRMLALMLALTLFLSLSAAVAVSAAETVPGGFTDVAEADWFYKDVRCVHDAGLMIGKGDGIFDPDGQITGGTYSGSLSDMTALRTANNYTEYGTFDASATIHDSDSGNDWHGFEIKTNLLHLVAAHVATTDSMASGAVSTTVVGRAEIPYISDIRDNTDGSISWDTRYLGVVNGLITHY